MVSKATAYIGDQPPVSAQTGSAHEPILNDNDTIAPTGAISSIAYLPEPVINMISDLYLNKGDELWGPFGFYDSFNVSRNWNAQGYIGIDVGPIAPMIENYRSGKLWDTYESTRSEKCYTENLEPSKSPLITATYIMEYPSLRPRIDLVA